MPAFRPAVVGIEMTTFDRPSYAEWRPAHLAGVYELVDALYIRVDPRTCDAVCDVFMQAYGDPDRAPRPTLFEPQEVERFGRFQEDHERQQLLDWAVDTGAAWAACFDSDEVLEPGGGRALRDLLTAPAARRRRLARVDLNYSSHHRPGHVLPRVGIRPWRAFRLDRAAAGYRYQADKDGLHCGSVPRPFLGAFSVPDLRIVHYHATTCAEFMGERAFYDQTHEVRKHGGIDWLYRCDRFGAEADAFPLDELVADAGSRLARVARGRGLTR